MYVQNRGRTALMLALEYNHTTTAQLLVGAGADKDTKDKVWECESISCRVLVFVICTHAFSFQPD